MAKDNTKKAQRAQITLGDIPINVYLMPDGTYKLAGRNVTDAVQASASSLSNAMGVKSIKALPGWERVHSTSGETATTVALKYALNYWHLMALQGNVTAQNLLTALRDSPDVLDKLGMCLIDIPIISKSFSSKISKRSSKQTERDIQIRLQSQLGGFREVICPVGKIDLLTDTEIIEVKEVKEWKGAIGQILTYGFYYPKHFKRIHLFGKAHEDVQSLIEEHCTRLDVKVSWD